MCRMSAIFSEWLFQNEHIFTTFHVTSVEFVSKFVDVTEFYKFILQNIANFNGLNCKMLAMQEEGGEIKQIKK